MKVNDKKTYYKVRESCTKGIDSKFTQLKAIDENSPIEHFESVYSVVTRFDDLQESLRVNDMIGVFKIASKYNEDGTGPSANATSIDLFHDVQIVEMDTIKLGNQYFMEYGQDYHGENVTWSGEKILNSCDDTLRDKLIESTRGWSALHKGGPTYLKLLMGLIVATSKKSLRSLLNKISTLKLTDFNGEDVGRAVSFLRGANLILRDNDGLPSDFLTLILNIFRETTCLTFKSYVTTLEHNLELGITNLSADDIMRLFENKYIDMLGRSEWTPKSITQDQQSGFFTNGIIMCFNCGGIGHAIRDCKEEINQEHIDIRKNIVFGKANKNGDGGKRRRRNKNKSKDESTEAEPNANNSLTIPPKSGETEEKTVNGTKHYWCSKCEKWTNHKTHEHNDNSTKTQQGNLANEECTNANRDGDIEDTSDHKAT